MPDGHIFLAGQMVFDADGKLSKDNGNVIFVSKFGPYLCQPAQRWQN